MLRHNSHVLFGQGNRLVSGTTKFNQRLVISGRIKPDGDVFILVIVDEVQTS
jgi:hypothetical protein